MINLTRHGWVNCPKCKHGALKTDRDFERNCCDACHMLQPGQLKAEAREHQAVLARFRKDFPWVADFRAEYPRAFGERPAFRSEDDTYGEGIDDRD